MVLIAQHSLKLLTKKSISDLSGVADKSEKNLKSINSVLTNVNTLAAPLTPVQFIVRLKYKLDRPLQPTNGWDSIQSDEDQKKMESHISQKSYGMWDYVYNYLNEKYWAKVDNWKLFSQSILESFIIHLIVFENYPNRGGAERIRYDIGGIDRIGVEIIDELYFNKLDTTLIIPVRLTCNNILVRSFQQVPIVNSFTELLKNTSFNFAAFQVSKPEYVLVTKKDFVYTNKFKVKSATFDPYLKIIYGKELLQSNEFTDKSIFDIKRMPMTAQYEFVMFVNLN